MCTCIVYQILCSMSFSGFVSSLSKLSLSFLSRSCRASPSLHERKWSGLIPIFSHRIEFALLCSSILVCRLRSFQKLALIPPKNGSLHDNHFLPNQFRQSRLTRSILSWTDYAKAVSRSHSSLKWLPPCTVIISFQIIVRNPFLMEIDPLLDRCCQSCPLCFVKFLQQYWR